MFAKAACSDDLTIVNQVVNYYQVQSYESQSSERLHKSMTKRTTAQDEDRLDLIFKALGDRSRRAILRRLTKGPCTVKALAEPLEMSLPAVSKHLKVLETAGLLQRRVDGRVHHCSLDAEGLREADVWLKTYRAFWDDTLDALAAFVEDKKRESK